MVGRGGAWVLGVRRQEAEGRGEKAEVGVGLGGGERLLGGDGGGWGGWVIEGGARSPLRDPVPRACGGGRRMKRGGLMRF